MANKSAITFSSLEQFPNEILFEIFGYISIHDLHRGFHKLNQRLDQILYSLTDLSLTLHKPQDMNDEAIVFFAPQIYHLFVKHPHPVEFHRFPALRSLTAGCPNDRQLRCVKSKYLPNLTHLTLGFSLIWDCDIMVRLCQRIISNKFPKLRYCSLWPPAFDSDCPMIQTPALTHVHLKEGNFDDLCVLLNACPNLKYLQMLVSVYAKAPIKPVQHTTVKLLDVSFIPCDPDWIDKLDQLLSLLPNLKQLFLDTCTVRLDFKQLSRILHQRVIHLKYIHCEIHAIAIPICLNNIRKYHTLFQNIDVEDVDDNECRCDGLKIYINGKRND